MLLGLLVYEMATGKRPFEDVYSLDMVVLSLLHGNMQLNVEADHFLQKRTQQKVGIQLPFGSDHVSLYNRVVCL